MVYEVEMSSALELYLNQLHLNPYKEVPFLTKRIDYVGIKPNFEEIVAIEMKIKNWQRALQQALTYRLCADKVFVALWHEFIHRAKKEVFLKYGIGILEVNEDVEVIQEAKQSVKIQQSLTNKIKSYIREQDKREDREW